MWLEDTVQPEGGIWVTMGLDKYGLLHEINDHNRLDDKLDSLEQYLMWGYKIEEL